MNAEAFGRYLVLRSGYDRLAGWIALTICASAGLVPFAAAQEVLRGRVTDAESGEPLPAANIHIAGTYRGTISNNEGDYQLALPDLPAVVVVRYIGYLSQERRIQPGDAESVDFRMRRTTYVMDEVVVSGEDPGRRIMREVIERKQRWRSTLETVTAEAYNRFALSNDTGIVSVIETVTDAHWDAERGLREVLKARRSTSNIDFADQLPAALFVSNLYDDDIDVSGHLLMGVTHPDALDHYDFSLDSTRTIDDHLVFDIGVRPKNPRKSAFVGRVSVLDEDYALIDVELAPGESFVFPPPIQFFEVTFQQQFSNFGGDYWLPVDFRSRMELKIGFRRILTFPAIDISQVSRFANYEVNAGLPDSLFVDDEILSVDSVAVSSSTALERAGVAVPLTAAEQIAYDRIDSTMTLRKAFKPGGLLGRMASDDDDNEAGRRKRFPIGITADLWYNRVDALHGGLGVRLLQKGPVRLGLRGGFNTGPSGEDAWTYGGTLYHGTWRSSGPFVVLNYDAASVVRWGTDLYARELNAIWTVFGGRDYYDYFRREGVSVTGGVKLNLLSSTMSISYGDSEHRSLERSTSWRLIQAGDSLRANPGIDAGRMRSLTFTVQVGEDSNPVKVTGTNRAVLKVEHSSDALSSGFEFTRYELLAEVRIPTLYNRRLLPNVLELRLRAGAASGTLPLQKFGAIEASMTPYAPFGAIKTLTGPPYEGDQWLGLFWEHNFRTIPFEMLGLDYAVRNSINVVVFGGHARTWAPDRALPDAYAPRVPSGFHHEAGFGISGILGLLRADLAFRIDQADVAFRIAAARIF